MNGKVSSGGAVTALSLEHIASWQVADVRNESSFKRVQAALPALQRGAVWRSGQVEELWDSIERRFPIGMLLLSGFREELKTQRMLIERRRPQASPTHMLLDGQQRANAIALGFYSPWSHRDENAPAALWMDLGEQDVSETKTSYRVVTRAHPWGYPHRDKQRLEMREIRLAMAAFRAANPDVPWHDRPPVRISWPWEGDVPIPVSVILRAGSTAPDDVLRELDKALPFWRSIRTAKGELSEALLAKALRSNVGRLKRLAETASVYQVPAQMVQLDGRAGKEESAAERADPTETLFVRVNSAGTPLQGEDLVYSIIKAIWPDAAAVVDKLEKRFVSAPRAAMLVARLALAPESGGTIPAVLEVTRFRRLVHGSEGARYRQRLENYLRSGAASLFAEAYDLLTGEDYGLPPVLAADLARGEEGREVILLLLRWVERLKKARVKVVDLSAAQRRRAIGALTCLRWFAPRADRCAAALWRKLEKSSDDKLRNFFSRASMAACFEPVKNQVPILVLPPPALLMKHLRSRVLPSKGPSGSVSNPKSKHWRNWNWYDSYQSNPAPPLDKWYKAALSCVAASDESSVDTEEALGASDRRLEEWGLFADKLWGERRLVLYAQRASLSAWFPRFDPTDPESVEETNRPWDMDHIHPRYFVDKRRNMPRLIKDWHSCIGNLRAWPFEANRADAEGVPSLKLLKTFAEPGEAEEATVLGKYGLLDPEVRQRSSFIGKDLDLWCRSTPEPQGAVSIPPAYLSKADAALHREMLLKAIVQRMAALYEEWYRSMDISALMPKC